MNTEWLNDPRCKRMMEEQPDWFSWFSWYLSDQQLKFDSCRGYWAYYCGPTHTHTIPLPFQAAWVLCQAKEKMWEMPDRCDIGRMNDQWQIYFNGYLFCDAGGDICKFCSEAEAVLTAYEHLYPEKKPPEVQTVGSRATYCPLKSPDFAAIAHKLRDMADEVENG